MRTGLKLSIGLAALLCLHVGTASAQTSGVMATGGNTGGYGLAGCGLGSILFGTDNSKVMQILAATTNGSFGSQTFGITSGTSNCTSGGVVKAEKEQYAFVEVNFQDLKRNMAAGGGEFLSSFATLLGCEDTAKGSLAKMTQDRYESIVPTADTTPMQLLGAVKSQIKATPTLASSCSDARAIARAQGKTPAKVKVAKK
jgi:hypothetical protein